MTSLQRQLVINYIVIVVVAVLVFLIAFGYCIRSYHFNQAEKNLSNQVLLAANLTARPSPAMNNLPAQARYIFNHIDTSQYVLVEVLNVDGEVVLRSAKPLPRRVEGMFDFEKAKIGEIGYWRGRNYVTGERLHAICAPLIVEGKIGGVLRFSASLEPIHQIANTMVFYSYIIGFIIIAGASGIFPALAKHIIAPLNALNETTARLIKEEFPSRLVRPAEAEYAKVADLYNSMFDLIERTERVQNEFISSISHELRTPLTAIKGWEETLSSGGLEDKEEIRLGMEIIGKEAERMVGLVEDLLDFSHLQAGRMRLHLEKVSINQLVEEVHDLLSVKAIKKSIALAMELGGGLPEIEGDGNRLKQVLLNILDNSLKFTPMEGSITISTHRFGEEIEIVIVDTGPGIAAADLPKIMSKFTKVDGRSPGSGLGLSIANEIVTLHGGQLSLSSELGRGTKAAVLLPIGGAHTVG